MSKAGLAAISTAKAASQAAIAKAKYDEQELLGKVNISRVFPTTGSFEAPALTFPYYKKKTHGGKKIMFFKYGRIWGVIVHPRTLIVDSEVPYAVPNLKESAMVA